MAEISEDLTVEILSRLPVKTLSRFKTVSKAWNTTISSHLFARKHLKYAKSKLKIMFQDTKGNFYYTDYDTVNEQEMFDLPYMYLGWVYNGCDGMFVVHNKYHHDAVCIWNPSTGKRKNLPNVPTRCYQNEKAFYGIGYDPTTEDYKVLRIEYFEDRKESEVYLYTLSNDSWRMLKSISHKNLSNKMVLVDNILHMLVHQPEVILSFDLTSEEFSEIPLHNCGEGGYIELIASSCWLCVVSVAPVINVWVMKEYGIEESWEKLFSIDLGIFTSKTPRPLHLSEIGEILFCDYREGKRDLVFYDYNVPKVRTIKEDCSDRILRLWSAGIFAETLISPYLAVNMVKWGEEVKGRNKKVLVLLHR